MIITTFVALGILVGLSVALIYWHEADKGTRILCSMFREETSIEHVTKTFDTADLLNYYITQFQNDQTILQTESPYNLCTSECTVLFDEIRRVVKAKYIQHFNLNVYIAVAGSVTLLLLSGFQLLLSLGFRYGKYALGSNHTILPKHLRIGSLTSSLFLIFGMLILFHQLEWIQFLPSDFPFSELNIFFGVIFLLSTLIYAGSKSSKGRKMLTPAAGLLYIAFLSATFVL